MTDIKLTDVVTQLFDILTPLSTEDRRRAISASLTLIGDEAVSGKPPKTGDAGGDADEPSSDS